MKLKELADWPPKWRPSFVPSPKTPILGEVGVLRSVVPMNRDDLLILTMELDGVEYVGILQIPPDMRDRLRTILVVRKGRPIREIGQLTIP